MTGSDTLSGDPKMGLLNQVSWRGVSRFTPLTPEKSIPASRGSRLVRLAMCTWTSSKGKHSRTGKPSWPARETSLNLEGIRIIKRGDKLKVSLSLYILMEKNWTEGGGAGRSPRVCSPRRESHLHARGAQYRALGASSHRVAVPHSDHRAI